MNEPEHTNVSTHHTRTCLSFKENQYTCILP